MFRKKLCCMLMVHFSLFSMHLQDLDVHKKACLFRSLVDGQEKEFLISSPGLCCSTKDLLLAAIENEQEKLVSAILLTNKNFLQQNSSLSFELMHAAFKNNNKALVHILLQHKADIFGKDCFGTTALQWAAKLGFNTTLKQFIKRGLDINERDDFGLTALHYAILGDHQGNNCFDIVVHLISHEADTTLRTHDGYTLLGLARKYACKKIIALFESFDIYCRAFLADPFQPYINTQDSKLQLPAWLCFKMLYLNEIYSDELEEVLHKLGSKNPKLISNFIQKCSFDKCTEQEIADLKRRKLPLLSNQSQKWFKRFNSL